MVVNYQDKLEILQTLLQKRDEIYEEVKAPNWYNCRIDKYCIIFNYPYRRESEVKPMIKLYNEERSKEQRVFAFVDLPSARRFMTENYDLLLKVKDLI